MEYKSKHILSFLFILSVIYASAQTEDLNFTLTSSQIDISGQVVEISSTIIKEGDTITWLQEKNGNSEIEVYNISSFTGSWDQSLSTGSINYLLDNEGNISSLNLVKSSEEFIAQLSFTNFNNKSEAFTFKNNSITYQ